MAWSVVLTDGGNVKHNHPKPAEHKISSKVSEDIQRVVHQDITKTSKDLLKSVLRIHSLICMC